VPQGPIVRTELLSMETPDGEVVEREVVRHPGAVAAVVLHQGNLVLVRQYRVALDAELLEIPAGKRDIAGEAPAHAVRREVIEEVGLDPQSIVELGRFVTAAGFCDEEMVLYAAQDCIEVQRAVDGVEEAHSVVVHVPVAEALATAASGGYTDAKTIIGILWAEKAGLL